MKNNSNRKKKSHKKLWTILAIIAVVVVVIVILAVRGLSNKTKQLAAAVNNTAPVETGQIEIITEGVGVISTVDSKMQMIDYNTTLRNLHKQNGERVAAGEVIAEFESIVLDETITGLKTQLNGIDSQLANTSKSGNTYVASPVSGRVKRIMAEVDNSVWTVQQELGALAEVSADGKLKVEFVTESAVVKGQKVKIIYGDDTIDGRIRDVIGNSVVAVFEDSDKYDIAVAVSVQTEAGAVLGSGVTACGSSVMITAESGVIKSVSVKHNGNVSAGSTIFRLKDVDYSQNYKTLLEQREQLIKKIQDAEEYRNGYRVVAEKDCIISELTAKEGDAIAAGSVLCKLFDTSAFQVVINIDELDIQGIEVGQPAEVTVDAIEDVKFQGTVSSVSLAGTNTDGVAAYQVSILLENATNLLPGMSANSKITIENKSGILFIPLDTIQSLDGEKSVTVVKEDGSTEKRKVTLGLVNNEKAEVIEGVSEGEKLQVIAKLDDILSKIGREAE